MIDYIKGGMILLFFVVLFYMFGLALTKKNKSFPNNVLIGYIFYSFFIAVLIIPIQLLKLSWNYALFSVIGVVITIFIFTIYRINKYKLTVINESFKEWLHKYYFLFLITIILFFIFLLQFDLIWINNHLDDGYYLVKIATLPYLKNPYSTTYATGLTSIGMGLDTYALSSIETEASVFVFLTKIDPVIYCRAVLNILHYFLAACTIYTLADTIIKSLKIRFNKNNIQYFSMVLLIFAFEYTVTQKTGLLVVQDGWQFGSAMWYGSSIVRVLGLIWIILPFIKNSKISIKDLLLVFIISFVLVSKSAIALPVIFISCMSYLFAFYFTERKKYVWLSLVLIIILFGYILPDISLRNQLINDIFIANRFSVLMYGTVLFLIVGFIFFPSLEIKRVLIILFFSFLLMIIPEVNDIFENISMFDFVARRAQTTLIYTSVIVAFIIFLLFINKIFYQKYKLFLCGSFLLLMTLSIASMSITYGNSLYIYKIMAINHHLMPNSTVQLSKKLNELSSETNQLNVMSPEWVIDTNHRHSLATMLRTYAPYVNSISAIGRYPVNNGNDFVDFTSEDQSKYNNFLSSPNEDSFRELNKVLNMFPINCIIFPNESFNKYYESIGFKLVDVVGNYYIYIK